MEDARINELLDKYCKFLPVPIAFGEEKEWKDGKETSTSKAKIINETNPAWTKKPADLKDEDYSKFYKDLYPMIMDEPLFHIHLNVDYPFTLTGILYFPKLKKNIEVQKNKIQLYSNQVFVTDSVEDIVPEFLTLLHGVLDSPDIPLNVSRSYLQSDNNVKKISNHISKKVSDRLHDIFKKDRTEFENKWDDLSIFLQYGMLTDEKFYERAKDFCVYINEEDPYIVLKILANKFNLSLNFDMNNARCSVCNEILKKVEDKTHIKDSIKPDTYKYHSEFYQCIDEKCEKIYWEGTHIKNLQKFTFELNERFA